MKISELMPELAKQADKYSLIRSMTHGKGHRRQCLAASSRNGQGVKPARAFAGSAQMRQDIGAQAVQVAVRCKARELGVECGAQDGQDRCQTGPVAVGAGPVQRGIERLGITVVCINQTGKHHPPCQRQVELGSAGPTFGHQFGHHRAQVDLG